MFDIKTNHPPKMCVWCDDTKVVSLCCEAAVYNGKCSDCGKFCTEVPCFDCSGDGEGYGIIDEGFAEDASQCWVVQPELNLQHFPSDGATSQ